MIGIVFAMQVELHAVKEKSIIEETYSVSGCEFFLVNLSGRKCILALSGIGKVNATICTQTMILKFGVDTIINVGVAGGINKILKDGSVLIAHYVVQHDFDTTAFGDELGLLPNFPDVKIPTSKNLIEKIESCAKSKHIELFSGTIASGDQFIASNEKCLELQLQFDADACDMESGAIAQVCTLNNIDFVIIRSISDSADDDAQNDYTDSLYGASQKVSNVLIDFIKYI